MYINILRTFILESLFMNKVLIFMVLLCSYSNISLAQTASTVSDAKKIGIIIALQNYCIPEILQEVKKNGSGVVIATRCGKAFPDNNLKQICMDTAQEEDLEIFKKMMQAAKGN